MRIISNYIFKEIFVYFLICLVTFTSLILTTRLLKFTNLIVNKGVDFIQVGKVFLAVIPTFLEIALPLSVLLGVMLAFARLSGDSEVIVLRAAGIKIVQLLKPVVLFGLLTVCFAHYISLELRPASYRLLNQTFFEIARNQSLAGITPGFFNKMGLITIYAEQVDYETGALHHVMIEDRREAAKKIIFATTGAIVPQPLQQNILINLNDGSLHEQPGEDYQVTNFALNKMSLSTADIYGDQSLKKDKRGRELTVADILSEVEMIESGEHVAEFYPELSGEAKIAKIDKRLRRLNMEYHLRFSTPWACFLMALLAIPLGIMPPRTQKTWGASFSLGIGLLSFIGYFALLTLGMTIAENGILPAYIAVWLPNIILACLCWKLLAKTNSEQWQSITDGLDQFVRRFKKSKDLA